MTPAEFVTKWRASELKERSASPRALHRPVPDTRRANACGRRSDRRALLFRTRSAQRRGARRTGRRLEAAPRRLGVQGQSHQPRHASQTAPAIYLGTGEPLASDVSDMARFRIRTNWTNSVSRTHEFVLEGLAEPATCGTRSRLAAPLRMRLSFSIPEYLMRNTGEHSIFECQ